MRYVLLGAWWLVIAGLSIAQVLPSGFFSQQPTRVIIPAKILTCPAWWAGKRVIYGGLWPRDRADPALIQQVKQQVKDRPQCLEDAFSEARQTLQTSRRGASR